MNVIEAVYERANTSILIQCGETEDIRVRVGRHMGSALSNYKLIFIIKYLTINIKSNV